MKILVCYRGMVDPNHLLKTAAGYARAFGAELTVITSLERGSTDQQEEINEAKSQLAYAKTYFDNEGFTCETDLLIHGLGPGEDIIQYAEKKGIDLIIIGIIKKSKVGKLLFGSTAQYVILKSPCPVLTVR